MFECLSYQDNSYLRAHIFLEALLWSLTYRHDIGRYFIILLLHDLEDILGTSDA